MRARKVSCWPDPVSETRLNGFVRTTRTSGGIEHGSFAGLSMASAESRKTISHMLVCHDMYYKLLPHPSDARLLPHGGWRYRSCLERQCEIISFLDSN